jgi:hypothetical protein
MQKIEASIGKDEAFSFSSQPFSFQEQLID